MIRDLVLNLKLVLHSICFKINLNISYVKVKFALSLEYHNGSPRYTLELSLALGFLHFRKIFKETEKSEAIDKKIFLMLNCSSEERSLNEWWSWKEKFRCKWHCLELWGNAERLVIELEAAVHHNIVMSKKKNLVWASSEMFGKLRFKKKEKEEEEAINMKPRYLAGIWVDHDGKVTVER